MINFGITGQESIECLGINAKMNEFQAAMGLCLLDNMNEEIDRRTLLAALYDTLLPDNLIRQQWADEAMSNHGYYPIVFDRVETLKQVQKALNAENIFPRRYFYPSLDSLDFLVEGQCTPVSRDIASRILCLPLYADLAIRDVEVISEIILDVQQGKRCV